MIQNKIHISPGCPRPSITFIVMNRGLKYHSFHLISPGYPRPSIALIGQNRGLKQHSFIHQFIYSVLSIDGNSWALLEKPADTAKIEKTILSA